MWKWIIGGVVGLVVIVVGGGVAFALSPVGKEWMKSLQPKEPVTTVRAEEVERGELVRTVSAPGGIEPLTMVQISAQVSARILDLPFRAGEEVSKGDVLVRLDDRDLVAALQSAQANRRSQEAQLEGAQAGLSRVKAERDRVRQLHASGDRSDAALEAAEAEFLRAESSLRMAEHAVEIAQANIDRAERDLDNTVIHAPIDGTIVDLQVEEGELVLGTFNNLGTPIMKIGDLTQMMLNAQVDETNIALIEPGQKARIYVLAYRDKTFYGTVRRVSLQRQTTSDGTGVFEVEISLDMTEEVRLAVGMTANTDIEVETLEDIIKVPSQAVLDRRTEELPDEVKKALTPDPERKDKTFTQVVFKIEDGKTVATPVKVGPSDLTHTAILEGLEGDERIVTGPYKVLVGIGHGQKVKIEGEEQPEEGEGAQEAPAIAADGEEAPSETAASTESAGSGS